MVDSSFSASLHPFYAKKQLHLDVKPAKAEIYHSVNGDIEILLNRNADGTVTSTWKVDKRIEIL